MLKEITIFPAHELIVQDLSEAVKNIQEKYPEEIEDIELIKMEIIFLKSINILMNFMKIKLHF